MQYFEQFTSNTLAGSGNQHHFAADPAQLQTGRVYYKITNGGTYAYSLLFSNIIDSTYSDGSQSHCNYICDSWRILEAKLLKCPNTFCTDFADPAVTARLCEQTVFLHTLTFGGRQEKAVAPGEFFCSDSVVCEFAAGEYLCLEMTFSGGDLPYHDESLLPIFKKTAHGWVYDKRMPLPGMIGCDRKYELRIGYLGDSITQGIGVQYNSYLHWNAVLSQKLGDRFAYWNMGLGYGRAADAASDGAWLFKARQNDVVFVCYGVNDIFRGRTQTQIIHDLETIVDTLLREGKKVVLQTVPPFDYTGELISIWKNVNEYILNTLSAKVSFVFDNVPILSAGASAPQTAKYGGHPDETGCAAWGQALCEALLAAKFFE